jgi:transcriptional regulator GlxA family with amidase domain
VRGQTSRPDGLSRAAFAPAFGDALGQTRMQYLTDWRMTLARDYLRSSEMEIVAEIAICGRSLPTPSRYPPGAWRQQQSTRSSGPRASDQIHLG